jgi:hypothetical protein
VKHGKTVIVSVVRKSFYMVMGCYAAIAVMAALLLDHPLKAAVWLFLCALAVKTWIATIKR